MSLQSSGFGVFELPGFILPKTHALKTPKSPNPMVLNLNPTTTNRRHNGNVMQDFVYQHPPNSMGSEHVQKGEFCRQLVN